MRHRREESRREGTLLDDVTGLTVALPTEAREALVGQLRAVGTLWRFRPAR